MNCLQLIDRGNEFFSKDQYAKALQAYQAAKTVLELEGAQDEAHSDKFWEGVIFAKIQLTTDLLTPGRR